MGLDSDWEEHLTRWIFGVQRALRTGAALLRRGARTTGRRSSGVGERLAGKTTDGVQQCCCSSHGESQVAEGMVVTPPRRSGVSRTQPSAASATTRIWERVTSDQYWERGRHEPRKTSSVHGAASRHRPLARAGATMEA